MPVEWYSFDWQSAKPEWKQTQCFFRNFEQLITILLPAYEKKQSFSYFSLKQIDSDTYAVFHDPSKRRCVSIATLTLHRYTIFRVNDHLGQVHSVAAGSLILEKSSKHIRLKDIGKRQMRKYMANLVTGHCSKHICVYGRFSTNGAWRNSYIENGFSDVLNYFQMLVIFTN